MLSRNKFHAIGTGVTDDAIPFCHGSRCWTFLSSSNRSTNRERAQLRQRGTGSTSSGSTSSGSASSGQQAQQPSGAQQRPLAQQAATEPLAAAQQQPAERVAARQEPAAAPQADPLAANQQPFAPLNAQQQQRLQQFLADWERQSNDTKTLECKFKRWHYDNKGAVAGIHTTKAEGVIRYSKPDKGLFRVDELVFFQGMQQGNPQFNAIPGQFGEHWVCNGTQLIEMDRSKKTCEIQDLPPEMQGQKIFNSPLPFVFNLDANQITQRYWVKLVDVPNTEIVLVEAWPKRQEDRAQYKLVQIGLDAKTFEPQALILYAPNFDAKTTPNRDQYEFSDVKRNAIGAGLQQFLKNFIPEKPPKDWKIVYNKFNPVDEDPSLGAPPAQQIPAAQNAQGPAAADQRRNQ